MAALDRGVRRDLIAGYIDKAKINWAHLALAQLIENGFVDRVLTTNFDPLVSRACALVTTPIITDADLKEIWMGSAEGMTEAEMTERWPERHTLSAIDSLSFESAALLPVVALPEKQNLCPNTSI
jgi:hypothetical protein